MKTHELILCPSCKGQGYTSHDECVDYHKRDYITRIKSCTNCLESGRVVKITEVTYKPFSLPE